MNTFLDNYRGFTLIEMAIVLAIVALLLGGLLPSISSQIEQQRRNDTRKQLDEVNTDGVEPMTRVVAQDMKKRADVVNDGEMAEAVTANAPMSEDNFFVVPSVME